MKGAKLTIHLFLGAGTQSFSPIDSRQEGSLKSNTFKRFFIIAILISLGTKKSVSHSNPVSNQVFLGSVSSTYNFICIV